MIRIKKHLEKITVKPGDILDFITVEWIEPCWEFDNPSALIYPIFKVFENSSDHDRIIENILIDISAHDGLIKSDADIWRCNPRYIRRIASEILNKKFNRKNNISKYRANIETHLFFYDKKENWISSEVVESKS